MKKTNQSSAPGYCLVLLSGLLMMSCGSETPTDPDLVIDPDVELSEDETEVADVKTPPDDSGCVDMYGSNSEWSDNCVLKLDGLYANSSYTLGVQRLLWCTGYAPDVPGTSSNSLSEQTFVTGIYDSSTEQAVLRYQVEHALDNHGAIDSFTWQSLQDQLVLVGANAAEYSSFSVSEGSCAQDLLFYQRNTSPQDWKMVLNRGGAELAEFSIEPR